MKNRLLLLLWFLALTACKKTTPLEAAFQCENTTTYAALETVRDFRSLFAVPLPKKWKTGLHYSTSQSSIYSADTTKQLTETTIIDIAYIHHKNTFDDAFKSNIRKNTAAKDLEEIFTSELLFANKKSYATLASGNKAGHPYQILQIFSQVNDQNFTHIKTEVYGEKAVTERFCKAITLLKKLTF